MFDNIREFTVERLNVEIMAHDKEWMMMVLIGPGIFNQATRKTITTAVSNYLSKTANMRHRLLATTYLSSLGSHYGCLRSRIG